jgi:hypothetical protein
MKIFSVLKLVANPAGTWDATNIEASFTKEGDAYDFVGKIPYNPSEAYVLLPSFLVKETIEAEII